ncbi:MAG: outer membrane beta-barrel protein [Xanthobacteraceae bacterium]
MRRVSAGPPTTPYFMAKPAALTCRKNNFSANDGSSITGTFNRFGWMLGAGVEYAVTNNITLKAEYNYLNFGTTNQTLTPNATDLVTGTIIGDPNNSKLTASVVEGGANFLFH